MITVDCHNIYLLLPDIKEGIYTPPQIHRDSQHFTGYNSSYSSSDGCFITKHFTKKKKKNLCLDPSISESLLPVLTSVEPEKLFDLPLFNSLAFLPTFLNYTFTSTCLFCDGDASLSTVNVVAGHLASFDVKTGHGIQRSDLC